MNLMSKKNIRNSMKTLDDTFFKLIFGSFNVPRHNFSFKQQIYDFLSR